MSKNNKREARVRKRNANTVDVPSLLEFTSPLDPAVKISWLVTQPTPRDMLLMRQWVRGRIAPVQSTALPFTPEELAGFSARDRQTILQEFARERARNGRSTEEKLNEADVITELMTRDGIAKMIWLSARRYQPNMRQEDVDAVVTESNYINVHATWESLLEHGEITTEEDGDDKSPKPDGST